jgi:eukaryotic translation initiation factor 2-alpha kinase 4
MDSPEDLQRQEITVLRSIYDEDFLESPPPKVWKVRVLNHFRFRVFLLNVGCSPPGSCEVTRVHYQSTASRSYSRLNDILSPAYEVLLQRIIQRPTCSSLVAIRFPKTYPSNAIPVFTIQKPIQGLSNDHVTKLSNAIHVEAQKNQGGEMVFQVRRLFEIVKMELVMSDSVD